MEPEMIEIDVAAGSHGKARLVVDANWTGNAVLSWEGGSAVIPGPIAATLFCSGVAAMLMTGGTPGKALVMPEGKPQNELVMDAPSIVNIIATAGGVQARSIGLLEHYASWRESEEACHESLLRGFVGTLFGGATNHARWSEVAAWALLIAAMTAEPDEEQSSEEAGQ